MHRACRWFGAYLHQYSIKFRYIVAWCVTCANALDDDTLECVQAIRHQLVARHITIAKGLLWYTPRPPVNHAVPRMELISCGGFPGAARSPDYDPTAVD